MDKQKIKEALITKLNETQNFFLETMKKYKKTSLEAPSATQTRSDTSRFEFETY